MYKIISTLRNYNIIPFKNSCCNDSHWKRTDQIWHIFVLLSGRYNLTWEYKTWPGITEINILLINCWIKVRSFSSNVNWYKQFNNHALIAFKLSDSKTARGIFVGSEWLLQNTVQSCNYNRFCHLSVVFVIKSSFRNDEYKWSRTVMTSGRLTVCVVVLMRKSISSERGFILIRIELVHSLKVELYIRLKNFWSGPDDIHILLLCDVYGDGMMPMYSTLRIIVNPRWRVILCVKYI